MGKQAKKWRIDLVLFTFRWRHWNSSPSLSRRCRVAVQTHPLAERSRNQQAWLMFKRGALVHFAVSQYEGRPNWPEKILSSCHSIKARWRRQWCARRPESVRYGLNEVLTPDNLLNIIGRFVQLKKKKTGKAASTKKNCWTLPPVECGHQTDQCRLRGGQKYLIQHSAGSGKSNSRQHISCRPCTINRIRNCLDCGHWPYHSGCPATGHHLEHADGVVGRINNKEGDGWKNWPKHWKPHSRLSLWPFPLCAACDWKQH